MDLAKALATAIVMMIPAFVGAAICWAILPSWFIVLCWLAFMVWLYKKIIADKLIPDLRRFIAGIKAQLRKQEKE